MRILGLDVGEKRIGVAKVDSSTKIALPVGFLENNESLWGELSKLTRLNNTSFFVLGLPRSNEGNETAQSQYVRNFAKKLVEKVPGAKVRFQDESLTSVEAEERLKRRKKKYEKGDIDTEAATIILQDFIENFKATGPGAVGETNILKKEADKIKLNTKKAEHKVKKATKWITGIIVLAILGLSATGVALMIRDQRYKKYAEQFAEIEAGMKAEVFNFTIRPGETIFEVKDSLKSIGYSDEEIEAGFNHAYNYPMLSGRPEGATLEGYLYGETHEFYADSTVEDVLNTFLSGMQTAIDENGLVDKYSDKGLSLFEGITLASIVQKEAPSPGFVSDQPTVAQVFLSRLEYGIALGSDVTVSYALDTIDPDRQTYSDNQSALKVDSCYNTRLYAGLPCGPIANPGLTALLAVAEPADTSYFYFLTGDDGVMYYSSTEAEHNQNIYSHCQNLCNVSL
ncbi:endolytic transglycosylase MltG [Candidatus Saccharibacteria bacterium]|nr:endolytic transglycosylase MltG [Candidatus Saccharibacteria bacterium]